MLEARQRGRAEGVTTGVIWCGALLVSGVFIWIIGDLVWGGLHRISWSFLTAPVADAGRAGGIGPILVSTAGVVGVCLLVATPIGVASAIFLAELTPREGPLGRHIRLSLDVLAGVPSIVFGLFGSAFFCKTLGLGFSILSGGLTLACMILPILIRTVQQGFYAVPDEYRHSAAALGISRRSTILRLLLPAAAPGVVVGLVLGIGRAAAETAALIFTSGYVDRMPSSLYDSGRALSVHIYDLSMNVPGGTDNAYGSALVLIAALLLINMTASALAERWLGRQIVRG
jgi:phosphate transport system permease protein